MIILLLYDNKYFVEKIEIRKNMLKDLTVSLTCSPDPHSALPTHVRSQCLGLFVGVSFPKICPVAHPLAKLLLSNLDTTGVLSL